MSKANLITALNAIRSIPHWCRTAFKPANWLTAIAFWLLTLKIVALNPIPASSEAVYELGVLCDAILTSIIASYIFYLFVVHIKELEDQSIIGPYIKQRTNRIIGECEQQLREIGHACNCTLELDSLTESTLQQALSKIAPYSAAPLVIGRIGNNANWYQYFDFHKTRTRESISRIMAQIIYVDSQLIRLVAEIDDCSHFSVVQFLASTPTSNTNLDALSNTFFDYCQRCAALKQYTTQKYS